MFQQQVSSGCQARQRSSQLAEAGGALSESMSGDSQLDRSYLEFLTTFRACPQKWRQPAEANVQQRRSVSSAAVPGTTSSGADGCTEEEFTRMRERLQLRVDDVLTYPDRYLSADLRQHRQRVEEVSRRLELLEQDISGSPDKASAILLLRRLDEELSSAVCVLRPHDAWVRRYYRELKSVRSDIDWADGLSADRGDAWYGEKQRYRKLRQQVTAAADAKDYQIALHHLEAVATAVKALAEQRAGGVIPAIDDAQSSTDAVAVVDRLQPPEIAALPPEKQLLLLQKLRRTIQCSECECWHTAKELKTNDDRCPVAECQGSLDTMEMKECCRQCGRGWRGDPCPLKCGTELTRFLECADCSALYGLEEIGDTTDCPQCTSTSTSDTGLTSIWYCPTCRKVTNDCPPDSSCVELCRAEANLSFTLWARWEDRVFEEEMAARAKVFVHTGLVDRFRDVSRAQQKSMVASLRANPWTMATVSEFRHHWAEVVDDLEGEYFLCLNGCRHWCPKSAWEHQGGRCPGCGNTVDRPLRNRARLGQLSAAIVSAQCQAMNLTWDFGDNVSLTRPHPFFPDRLVSFDRSTGPVKIVFQSDPARDTSECDTSGYPTFIQMSLKSDSIRTIEDWVDTVVHETTHAFQVALEKKCEGGAPFDGADPTTGLTWPEVLQRPENRHLLMQAQMFDENGETYFRLEELRRTAELRQLSFLAYQHQPTEEHAWQFAHSVVQTLFRPPLARSFESHRGLADRHVRVESVTRSDPVVLRTADPHGIRPGEWGGEKPQDRKLVLETHGRSTDVQIAEILDARTLQLHSRFKGADLAPQVIARDGHLVRPDRLPDDDRIRNTCQQKHTQLSSAEIGDLAAQCPDYTIIVDESGYLLVTDDRYADVTTARLYLDDSVSDLS